MTTREHVDLTARYNAALDRLQHAPIGCFTFDEFRLIERSLNNRSAAFRIHRSFDNIPGERWPEQELARVEEIERLATKAGV